MAGATGLFGVGLAPMRERGQGRPCDGSEDALAVATAQGLQVVLFGCRQPEAFSEPPSSDGTLGTLEGAHRWDARWRR